MRELWYTGFGAVFGLALGLGLPFAFLALGNVFAPESASRLDS